MTDYNRPALRAGDGVGWMGAAPKMSARNEILCKLIERMDQATEEHEFLQLVAEFAAIRAFALAKKCQRMVAE